MSVSLREIGWFADLEDGAGRAAALDHDLRVALALVLSESAREQATALHQQREALANQRRAQELRDASELRRANREADLKRATEKRVSRTVVWSIVGPIVIGWAAFSAVLWNVFSEAGLEMTGDLVAQVLVTPIIAVPGLLLVGVIVAIVRVNRLRR